MFEISVNTESEIVNAVLNSKLSLARKNGIQVTCSISNDFSGIEDTDWCSLLGNLLDNAIESYLFYHSSSEQMKYIIIPSALGIALPFLFTDKYYMGLKQVLVLLIINFIIIFLSILAIKIKVRSVLRQGVLYYYE